MVAMTGLGQPGQFFEMLRGQGLDIEAASLGDHEAVTPAHLDRRDEQVVLITAKDAVKLPECTDPRVWVVAIEVVLPSSLLILGSAPLFRRNSTIAVLPYKAAKIRGFCLLVEGVVSDAPASTAILASSRFPFMIADQRFESLKPCGSFLLRLTASSKDST